MEEQEGLSFREAEQVVRPISFWMNTPGRTLGPPTSQLSYTRCFCMQHQEGGKRQNVCATGATKAA